MKTSTMMACLAVSATLLTGCSDATPTASDEIDARSYYENYTSPEDEETGGVSGAVAPTAAVDSNAPDATEPPHTPGIPPAPGNTFVDAGLRGFVATATDRRSTFALDVDTASWTIARTILRSGKQPPPASVRLEEWVNAQPYSYADPKSDLGVDVDYGTVAGDEALALMRLGVSARDVNASDRAPINVTLVVDVSGSMDSPQRLGLVKSSLALLAKHLKPTDTVSVVTYDDQAKPVLAPTPVRDTETILQAVEELEPGGSTNLEAGLRAGYREARKNATPRGINVVVLCSDGVANVGVTDPDDLATTISEGRNDGINLVTVGYGMDSYNDDTMEQLANNGDGFYRYVDTFNEARRVFVRDLEAVMTPVAADAKTQVRFDPEAVDAYRLLGYENRAIADSEFTKPSVDAGEISAGQDSTALYELDLADGVEPGTRIGVMELRWVGRDGKRHVEETPLVAPAPQAPGDADTRLAAVTADLAQLVKGGQVASERGLTFASVEERARALAAEDVPGADRVVNIAQAAAQQ